MASYESLLENAKWVPKQSECFKNSWLAWGTILELGHFSYVEGYFVHPFLGVICHGWLEDGVEIVDVTPGYEDSEPEQYFPAAKFSDMKAFNELLYKAGSLPVSPLLDTSANSGVWKQANLFRLQSLGITVTEEMWPSIEPTLTSPKTSDGLWF